MTFTYTPNELAALAHPAQAQLWDPRCKFELERSWWVSVMRHQKALGVDIPDQAIQDYSKAATQPIDLASIAQRELVTRHDVKARLEEFNAEAGGWQHAHKGMTGRDLDDNVELIQARLGLVNLLAQAKDTGAPESVQTRLEYASLTTRLRGIWGPVGTGQDMIDLLGSAEALQQLNRLVCADFGYGPGATLDSVGQVYPRSIDYQIGVDVVAALTGAGIDPGWTCVMRGYLQMLGELAGGQWLEGDVSCSVVRRVAIANLFLAASAALSTLNPNKEIN